MVQPPFQLWYNLHFKVPFSNQLRLEAALTGFHNEVLDCAHCCYCPRCSSTLLQARSQVSTFGGAHYIFTGARFLLLLYV